MSTPIEVRARLLLEGVTKGPWTAKRDYVAASDVITDEPYYEGKFLVAESIFQRPDQEFIAACRTLVPELCDEIDRLRELAKRLSS